MRSSSLLVLILSTLILSAAFAQTQNPAAPAKPASIEGIVNNASTGDPIPHTHVLLRGSANGAQLQYGAMTTADGKFSITGLPPAVYSVIADRVGYVMAPAAARTLAVRLQADEKKSDFRVPMLPTGQITGRVTDPEGEPLENCSVVAEQSAAGMASSAHTDEKGMYRIGGLAPGKYRVRAQFQQALGLPPEVRTDGTEEPQLANTYYPGVLTPKEGSRVEVRAAGDSGGVNIQLKRVPRVRVSGKVLGRARASEISTIMVETVPRSITQAAQTKPDGSFNVWRLSPGKYRLTANSNSPGGEYLRSAPAEIEVTGDNLDGLALRLIPSFEVTGQVNYENDQAKQMPQPPQRPGQQQPNTAQSAPRIQRSLFFHDAVNNNMQVGGAQVTDDDTFRAPAIQPGRYRITTSWNTVYVKSLQLGSAVIDGDIADFSNGPSGSLTVTLAAASGSVSGTVQDDSGTVQGTRVALTAADPARGFPTRYATAKADGSYSIANLPPGSYKIVAVSEADTDQIQRLGLDDYEDQMEAFELQTDQKVTKDLRRRSPR